MGSEVRVSRRISRRIEVGRVGERGSCGAMQVHRALYRPRCIPEHSFSIVEHQTFPRIFAAVVVRNVHSILQEIKKRTPYYTTTLPLHILCNTTPSFHPSTMHHITQPTEAHTPQAAVAADPSSDPNTAGEEAPPDNTNSRTPARPASKQPYHATSQHKGSDLVAAAYAVTSLYYHTDPDRHHIP